MDQENASRLLTKSTLIIHAHYTYEKRSEVYFAKMRVYDKLLKYFTIIRREIVEQIHSTKVSYYEYKRINLYY